MCKSLDVGIEEKELGCGCRCSVVFLLLFPGHPSPADRLAQIYHFVVTFLPDITVLPLFSKTLKHFVCPNVQTHAREKEDLGSVENQHKTMSPFSLRIALADPRGLLDKQVFRWTSQRVHLPLSALLGEATRECAQMSSPCSSSDHPALTTVISPSPFPASV